MTTDEFGGVAVSESRDEFGGVAIDEPSPVSPVDPPNPNNVKVSPYEKAEIEQGKQDPFGARDTDFLRELATSNKSLIGLPAPEDIPSGTGPITIPLSAAAKTLAGFGQFATSPRGAIQLGALPVPILGEVVAGKFLKDLTEGASQAAGDLSVRLTQPNKTREDWQAIAEDSANIAASLYGMKKTAPHVTRAAEAIGARAPITAADQLRLYEREVQNAPINVTSEVTPIRQLGISPVELGRTSVDALATPERQALADQAIREPQDSKIIAPGELTALDLLRRQDIRIEDSPARALLERSGGGEALGGKISFASPAEARGVPNARQSAVTLSGEEKSTLQSFVNEEAENGEVFDQSKLPRGVSYRRPRPAPTKAEYERTQRRESISKGLESPSGYYLDEPHNAPLPEPEPEPQQPQQRTVIAAGSGRPVIVKPTVMSALQRSRLRVALQRGASEEVIKNILRVNPEQIKKSAANAEVIRDEPPPTPEEGGPADSGSTPPPPPAQPVSGGSEIKPADPAQSKGFKRQDYSPEDLQRYNALKQQSIPKTVEEIDSPAFQLAWKEFEALRNKYDGMPPKQMGPAGLISGTAVENWANKTIVESQGRLASGLDPELLTAYAVKGAAIIERGVTKFAEWSAEMLKQYGDAIKPHLENIFRESLVTARDPRQIFDVEGETVKMRKLSDRATTSDQIPAGVRETIAKAPESFYTQQSVEKVTSAVKSLSDSELADVSPESNVYTAAQLERANRLFDAGKDADGYAIFSRLSEELTRMGQVINQAKLLKGLNPSNVVKVVNEGLRKAGRDALKPEQATALEGLSRERIEAERALRKATEQWKSDPTDANAKLAESALDQANDAALQEQTSVHKYEHRSMASLLKAILQGNLLTPISEVANIVGNVSFLPFRIGTRTIAAGIDTIDSYLRDRPREVAARPIAGTKETLAGAGRGLKQIPGILLHGSGAIIKGESRAGLHPLEAWAKQFAKNPDMPTVNGRVPFSDRVSLAIEGTFGVPAEAMLRGLGAGDAPFREAARARYIAEAAKLNGVPDSQLSMAQKFPELFFDPKVLSEIESATAKDLFQGASPTLQHITSAIKAGGDWIDLAVATAAPYKLTPWNIIREILSYNPLVAAAKTAFEAKRGNIRNAELNAGKMIVGGMLTGAGVWLYSKGLLAPSMDQSDEAQKARVLAGEVLPPNHVNISGLKRALSGGDPAFQAGDETIDVFRAGGLAGSAFYMTANIGRDLERKSSDQSDLYASLIKNSIIEQARFGVNQSFLKGVAGVLQSITSGETDNFTQAFANSVLSIPLPNTLSAISRATRDYRVDMKPDEHDGQISKILKTRLGFAGLDDYLPLKRGLWGEPLRETPEGRNAILYHFFDISKGKQVTSDPVPLELYKLWRKTANTEVIPSIPSRELTVRNQTYKLDNAQYSRFAELVGQNRRKIVDMVVINPYFQKLSDENKIKVLARSYQLGADRGKALLWSEVRNRLEKKPEKPGFNLP